MEKVLVTGGAGYIGSHTCVALAAAGYEPVVLDNFVNSTPVVLDRLERIIGRRPVLIAADIRDCAAVEAALRTHDIRSVIHFAALKAVGESLERPIAYYRNNVFGTLQLIEAMTAAGVRSLVFSSSANVYGDPDRMPVEEDFPLSTSNPYGQSKLMVEQILADLSMARPDWRIARLRYFNPFGAHESGLIGEDPRGTPSNLGPFVAQVAAGKVEMLSVYGDDYATRDGTGVRDFIHVMDLAEGHIAALRALEGKAGLTTVNLGSGTGYTVLEMVKAFEAATGRKVPFRIAPRRTGDIAESYADVRRAESLLGWQARRTLEDMCRDFWRWQTMNPDGFASVLAEAQT